MGAAHGGMAAGLTTGHAPSAQRSSREREAGRPGRRKVICCEGLKFLFLCLTAAAVRTLSIKPRSGCDSPSILSIRNCERVTGCHSMVVKSAKRSQLVGEEKRAKRKRDLFLVLFCILCDGRVALYTAKTLP